MRDEIDRAAGGVLAVQGALRSAQYFDPFEIVELDAEQREVAFVDFVDVARHRARLIEAVVEHRHAAQRKQRRALADDAIHLKVGHLRHEVGGGVELDLPELRAGESGHGDRHGL